MAVEGIYTDYYGRSTLKAYWRLESNANDSKNSNNLTLHGSVSHTTGKFGNAASFTASDNNGYSDPGATLIDLDNKDFSVSHWAKFNTINDNTQIWMGHGLHGPGGDNRDSDTSMYCNIFSDGKVGWSFWFDDMTPQTPPSPVGALQTGVWYHFLRTFKASTKQRTVYVNGVQTAQDTAILALRMSDNSVKEFGFGSAWDNGNYVSSNFNGLLDDVMVFYETLTAQDAVNLYNYQFKGAAMMAVLL